MGLEELDWLPRDNAAKDHQLFGDEWLGTEAPCTLYEKKPLKNADTGETVPTIRATANAAAHANGILNFFIPNPYSRIRA